MGYSHPNQMEHVYIVTEDGKVLDPVLGQKQDGSERRYTRPRLGQFNKEVKYKHKKDYDMPELSILNGCETINKPTAIAIPATAVDRGTPNRITRSKAVRFGIMPQIVRNRKVMGCTNCNGGCGK